MVQAKSSISESADYERPKHSQFVIWLPVLEEGFGWSREGVLQRVLSTALLLPVLAMGQAAMLHDWSTRARPIGLRGLLRPNHSASH